MHGRQPPTALRLRQAALALLLAGTSGPTFAISEAGSASAVAGAQPQQSDLSQDIIVNGKYLFPDVQPERDLDPDAIESYGTGTIHELIGELQSELGDDQDPLILVNGQPISSLDEISGLPVEVVRNAKVLPRGAAVRLGGTSSQRVISLTLSRKARNATATLAPKYATDGGWHSLRSEGILTLIRGSTRANLAIRDRNDSALFESERSIIQPDPFRPFALTGNVVSWPFVSGEIDPLLSAIAGQTVSVAPVPSSANPSLADFAAGGNAAAETDLGHFRTLRPDSDNLDINGTVSAKFAPWLTSTASIRYNRSTNIYLRGLPSGLFILSADNPGSPFSRDVALAYYGPDPLRYRQRHDGGEGSLTLNGQFGQWTGRFNARHGESTDTSLTDGQAQFNAIPLDGGLNPFSTHLGSLIGLRRDRTSARTNTTYAELSLTGPAAALPAGPLQATVDAHVAWNRLHAQSTFSSWFGNGDFSRNEQAIRIAADVPLTSRANGILPALGDTDVTAELGRVHYSDAGSLTQYALGLTWSPVQRLRLRASIERNEAPPSIQLLGNPAIISPDVRVFDPLTGETLDVSQISGGNPLLRPQKTDVRRLTALLHVIPRFNLDLNAEYTDTETKDFVSSLPDASAAIMLAFPDRFIRDSNGVLTTIDLRPVNFDSDREKRFRWGFSMNARLGGYRRGTGSAPRTGPRPPTTYLQLSANHSVVFSDQIRIREGLDPVDLLGGGAIGIGGGRLRHQVDGTAAITSGGVGGRIGMIWRGPSSLESRVGGVTDTLHFSPVFQLNLRAFADMRRFFPTSAFAKRLRISLEVMNATNGRQHVRNSLGNTPLQYQPGYRDPIGRTIEIEFRKVF